MTNRPSPDSIGWRPAAEVSMMASRRKPRARCWSVKKSSSSGPRCAMRMAARPTHSVSGPAPSARARQPVIPHMRAAKTIGVPDTRPDQPTWAGNESCPDRIRIRVRTSRTRMRMRSGHDSFPAQVGWSGRVSGTPIVLAARMCGITGCLALADGAGPDTEWVGRAAMRIAHRGPDDEDFFTDQHLALGFRRLAIIDTSAAGRQPMLSGDGRFVMVFDGEIYNYVELAQRLHARGVRLRSRSAAEVLVEMYAWLGKDVVRQLRGMYAFAIWDRRNRELFCARDPFGIKPFFYALTAGGERSRSGT